MVRQIALGDQQRRVGSKKSVQQGHSRFCARSVLARREHGKGRERRWRLFSTDP